MNWIQVTSSQRCYDLVSAKQLRSGPSTPCVSLPEQFQLNKVSIKLTARSSSYLGLKINASPRKLTIGASGVKQSTPVCLFGGKGKSENNVEGSPWKALEKAMGNLKKETSVEDVLRQQIQKGEYVDGGGSGGKSMGGGGGGGNDDDDGDGYGDGDSGDISLLGMLDETVQVILATIGLILAYVYIIEGDQLTVFIRDIIKFLFTGRKSLRLTRFIDKWVKVFEEMQRKDELEPDDLPYAIVNTTTWFDSPRKYKRYFRVVREDDDGSRR